MEDNRVAEKPTQQREMLGILSRAAATMMHSSGFTYQDLIDQWWFKLGATLRQLADDCDGPVLPAYIKRAQRPRAFRVMVNAQEAAHVDGLPSWPVMVFAGAVDDARAKAVEQFTAANPWITSDDQVYPGNTSRIPAGSESAAFIAAGHPLIDNDALNFNQVGE